MQTMIHIQRAQPALTRRCERREGMQKDAGIESAAETDDDFAGRQAREARLQFTDQSGRRHARMVPERVASA